VDPILRSRSIKAQLSHFQTVSISIGMSPSLMNGTIL
jgi:hypothetical protein